MAVINDTYADAKMLMARERIKASHITAKTGMSQQTVSINIMRENIVVPSFVKVIEAIGYDIKLEYVKRENTEPEQK